MQERFFLHFMSYLTLIDSILKLSNLNRCVLHIQDEENADHPRKQDKVNLETTARTYGGPSGRQPTRRDCGKTQLKDLTETCGLESVNYINQDFLV